MSLKKMNKSSTKKERSEAAAMLGRKSAQARLKKYGKNYMQELAKLGGKARWSKHDKPE